MTKLEFTISASSQECLGYHELTARILGLPQVQPPSTSVSDASSDTDSITRINFPQLLADDHEREKFQSALAKLTTRASATSCPPCTSFETLNLVFRAPHAPEAALPSDRSPLQGVFSSPIRALHTSGPLHLSCFTHLQFDPISDTLQVVAMEYSREHRSQLLAQEFASWLVEEHIEKSVIVTRADGTIVFWNRFATSLYQYTPQEAMGKEIRSLIATQMSMEQGNEMMERMSKGEHFSTMYLCSRKDKSQFMAHATTTPILDQEGNCQVIVGVSADYSELHDLVTELDELNANLEKEVVARTEQLLAREKHLRMIGSAMRESDTGVLITDENYKITWCNDAVSRMLGLRTEIILGMFPWNLPLQQEHKNESSAELMHDESAHSESLLGGEHKLSSLESYFAREKEFHEQETGIPRNSFSALPGSDDYIKMGLGIDRNAAAKVGAAPLEGEESSFIADFDVASPPSHKPSKRPPMAAICYRIDQPNKPLHVMVSVLAMPPDAPISVKRSASAKSSRRAHKYGADSLGSSSSSSTSAAYSARRRNSTETSQMHFASKTSSLDAITKDMNDTSNKRQFMITLRDITAERKAEEAQLIAERASAANEAKTQMMQMLSHELRTPLQGIMGVASTSMMDIEDNEKSNGATIDEGWSVTSPNNGGGGGVRGPMYDSLSTILASSRLLLTLINNTLDTRKINADMMQKIELSSVSMSSCVRDSFQYCGPFATINEALLELADADQENVTVSQILSNTSTMPNLTKKYSVTGNRLRLEQVIVNLLSNGIKYTTPGTSVVASIRTSTLAEVMQEMKSAPSSSLKFLNEEQMKELNDKADEENVDVTIFSVRDHGKGIPPEEYGKVFGEFQQLEVSAEKDNKYEGGGSGQSSGSGLGLNLSMKFVTLMGGHIWFENCTDGNGGVTFSFYLISARRETTLAVTHEESGGESKRGMMTNESNTSTDSLGSDDEQEGMSRFRVLLIDDSMINLKVLARMLNKLKVQHCKTALSGAAALEYLEPIRNDPSLVPNLILCDLQMPGMDGYELMAHLREMNICSSPIIMACSADWGSETEGKCHDVGFDGLLRKPITVTYLQEFLAQTKLNHKAN